MEVGEAALATGETLPAPSAQEVCSILVEHLENLYAFYGELQGVRIARKHLGWYAKDREENAAFRSIVNRAETAAEQLRLTREYFGETAALAQAPNVAKNLVGPIFIEMIQRENHLSFGEGNFGALFRSIERDQARRGYLEA